MNEKIQFANIVTEMVNRWDNATIIVGWETEGSVPDSKRGNIIMRGDPVRVISMIKGMIVKTSEAFGRDPMELIDLLRDLIRYGEGHGAEVSHMEVEGGPLPLEGGLRSLFDFGEDE